VTGRTISTTLLLGLFVAGSMRAQSPPSTARAAAVSSAMLAPEKLLAICANAAFTSAGR
jgi:hypothetical protein